MRATDVEFARLAGARGWLSEASQALILQEADRCQRNEGEARRQHANADVLDSICHDAAQKYSHHLTPSGGDLLSAVGSGL